MTEQAKESRDSKKSSQATAESSRSKGTSRRERSGSAVRGAKGLALRVADQAKSRAVQRLSQPVSDIDKLAKSLRLTGQQLEGNIAVPYIDKLAGGLERISGALGDLDAEEALRNVEKFAQRRPWLFLGGVVGLGIAGARLVKSSAQGLEPREVETPVSPARPARTPRSRTADAE